MAAPHAAAVASLLYQLKPSISPVDVAAALQISAQPFPNVALSQCTNPAQDCPCTTAICGSGILDAGAATDLFGTKPSMSMALPWMSLLINN